MVVHFSPVKLFGNQSLSSQPPFSSSSSQPLHLQPLTVKCLQNFTISLVISSVSPRSHSSKARLTLGDLCPGNKICMCQEHPLGLLELNKGSDRSEMPAKQRKSTFPPHLSPEIHRGQAENHPICSLPFSPSLLAVWTLINSSWNLVCPACL